MTSSTKRLRRLLIICAVMIAGFIASGTAGPAHAAVVKENAKGISIVQNLGKGSDGKTWLNPHYKTVPQYLFTIKTGGEEKYGYCFQTGKLFSNKYTYTAKRPANASAWTNLSASRQRIIRLVMFYGYNNGKGAPVSGANTNDYYAATQVLVWEAADGDIALSADGKWSKSTNKHDNLISGRTKATACYNWIKSEISRHVKGPSYGAKAVASAKTYTMKYDYSIERWKTVLTDTAGGNYYKLGPGTASALDMNRNGYQYTFTADRAGTHAGVMMNQESAGTSQELMVFKPSNSGKQAIVIGAADTTRFYANFRTEKTGSGTVIKENSDGSSPKGFSFLIENAENGYSRIHTTDEEGRISLELYPGTYTVTEQLTAEQKAAGFITPAGGTLEITEGNTSTLSLKNQRKEVPYQIQKTSDNGSVAGFEFAVYKADGTEVHRAKTSDEGLIEGTLYPGEYIVKELLTEEQLKAGYRGGKPQSLKITSEQSGTQILRFHNLWEPIEGKIAIRKTVDDGGPEGGFAFDIEGILAENGEPYISRNCVTDVTGQYLTEELEPGTYTITEVMTVEQAKRYEPHGPETVVISEAGQGAIVNFENKAKRTGVTVNKTSEDGNVEGVQFAVTGTYAWGGSFGPLTMTTDENGQFTIDLQPGTYTFTEVGEATEGYKTQPPEEITVTGDESPLNINFVNIPNSITLTKYEMLENGMKTNTPVAGAVYEVYRVQQSGGDEVYVDYGRFTTDADGQFIVKGVVPGKYYFSEVSAPNGYVRNETPAEVRFEEDDVGIEVTDHDRRASGRITVIIKDNQGNPVEGTEIGIYLDPGCSAPLGTYVTDETGRLRIEDLPWGHYYIKETEGTRGYEENKEIKEIQIGKDGVIDAELEILKEQKRGRVMITKTDETGELKLQGAQFSLYKTDGTLVEQGLQTDADGQLTAEGLEWGSYYFQEIKAPEGYGIDADPVRFSVNATTGGILQEMTVINESQKSTVIIDKKIKAEDLHFDHGVPTFTFVLSGTTVDGENKKYVQQVTFSERYVNENKDSDGYVTNSVIFTGLKAGEYTCTEKDAIRYELSSVQAVSGNCTVSEDGTAAGFVLEGQDSGQALFINEKTDWQDYSDSTAITNIIKSEKKLTALAVEYLGPEVLDGNMPFDPEEYLEVTAFYDDGSERALAADEYTMLNGYGSVFERTDIMVGKYTIMVLYSEENVLRSGSFSFRIEGVENLTVDFVVNGGSALEPLSVWKYDMLSDHDAAGYTTEKDGFRFAGWYLDEELSQPFTETDPITESVTLYAEWEQLHLEDYSWDQICEMSAAGTAQTFLGECFEAVKADLSDDGMLSAENYKHTKAFDCQGTVCHAMIAGFGHDDKTDGTKAGISFLVYEPAAAKAMITADTGRDLGWDSSNMRTEVLPEILESLPEAMRNVLCTVVKTDIAKKGTDISVHSTEDILWLPSQTELYGADGQYALFQGLVPDDDPQSEAVLAAGAGYWTRSVDPSLDRAFYYVDAAGNIASQ